jgi:hypothetical protein
VQCFIDVHGIWKAGVIVCVVSGSDLVKVRVDGAKVDVLQSTIFPVNQIWPPLDIEVGEIMQDLIPIIMDRAGPDYVILEAASNCNDSCCRFHAFMGGRSEPELYHSQNHWC